MRLNRDIKFEDLFVVCPDREGTGKLTRRRRLAAQVARNTSSGAAAQECGGRRGRLLLPFLTLLSFVFVPQTVSGQGACRSADSTSAAIIESVGRVSTATSGDDVQVRAALHLPQTSQLAVVTSSSVCTKARNAFVAEFASNGTVSSQVYVISVGNNTYAVVDPGYKYNNVARGRWSFIYFIDSQYKKLSILA